MANLGAVHMDASLKAICATLNQSLLSGQAVRLSKVHSSEQVTPPAVDEHILSIPSVFAHPGALEVGGTIR